MFFPVYVCILFVFQFIFHWNITTAWFEFFWGSLIDKRLFYPWKFWSDVCDLGLCIFSCICSSVYIHLMLEKYLLPAGLITNLWSFLPSSLLSSPQLTDVSFAGFYVWLLHVCHIFLRTPLYCVHPWIYKLSFINVYYFCSWHLIGSFACYPHPTIVTQWKLNLV